jgi:hypothetical protein
MPLPTSEYKRGALRGKDGFARVPFESTFARKQYGAFDHFCPGFYTSTTAYPGFTVTQNDAGTLGMDDAVGGWLKLIGGSGDGDGIQMQSAGEMFKPAANKDIWFEASIKITDADDLDWMVGLAVHDTDVFLLTSATSGSGAGAGDTDYGDPASMIVFRGDDGDANIDFQVRSGGTGAQTDTTVDVANATAIRVGFHVDGVSTVTPYINGTAYTAVTSNIPTTELAITFAMSNGGTTANNVLALDWYRCLQIA